jgi:hypothetical protein
MRRAWLLKYCTRDGEENYENLSLTDRPEQNPNASIKCKQSEKQQQQKVLVNELRHWA